MPRKKKRTDENRVDITMHGRQVDLMKAAKAGELNVDEWDLEELQRGYRRASDGTFRGRPPNIVPRVVHEELVRRVKSKVQVELLMAVYEKLGPTFRDALDGKLDAEGGEGGAPAKNNQLRAAQFLHDRLFGQEPIKVQVSGGLKHEEIIKQVTVNRGALIDDEEEIIDADIIDEDDEEWED